MCKQILQKGEYSLVETSFVETCEVFGWKINNYSDVLRLSKENLLPYYSSLKQTFLHGDWKIEFCPNYLYHFSVSYESGSPCTVRFSMCAMASSGQAIPESKKEKTLYLTDNRGITFKIEYSFNVMPSYVQSDGSLNLKFSIKLVKLFEKNTVLKLENQD
eukprot:GHVP01028903.1.p1 GENE.GHVP01028903.1~~GHVP01028903.1.p1  ORF type:complete len:174 (+),score=18.14 GHVP01028903.1:43-522(+)